VAIGLGWWREDQPIPPDRPQTVRIVQPNIPQAMKWDRATAEENLRGLIALSAAGAVPDLVVWPETALPYLYDGPGLLLPDIAQAVGRPMLVGAIRLDGELLYNAMIQVDAEGTVQAIYDKHHLVPFGEYIPFGAVLSHVGLRAFTAQGGYGYSAGPGPALLDLGPFGKVLPLICYEAIFPQDLRGTPRPDWLFQGTNDAWFGTFSGPYQHLAQARLRAVEQGLPMLRAANTGVSAVIDAHGKVRQALDLGVRGVIDTAVPGALPETLYARTGDAPLALILAALLSVLLLRARRETD
jgi:apolipoprotein N-acyltransferase